MLLLPAGLLLGQADEPKDAPPVHQAEIDELAVRIRALYLREDHEPIRAALRELQDACRELNAEDRLIYGRSVVSFDLGLHNALDRTRALAADGLWEDSEKQYEWVLRTCTRCHQETREAGLGPATPLP